MSDVNAELLAFVRDLYHTCLVDPARGAPVLTCDCETCDVMRKRDRLLVRVAAAQGAEPNGGEESVGVTRTCACEPMCGFVCAQCSEVRT